MKEQVITPRAGRGGGASKGRAGEIVQRPAARRGRGTANASAHARNNGWGKAMAYLPRAAKLIVAVVAGLLLFAGYRAAASASFFRVGAVDVSGTSRASSEDIKAIVKRGAEQVGVWRADLDAISRELKKVAWVREAVVSRVLPDGLRVRVTERAPRAIVRTSGGKFLWVDDEAVSLGAASPTDQIFMHGWDESGTEATRAQNRERIQKFLEMTRDWEAKGISRRVSEADLTDLHYIRVHLTGDDSEIEVQLGGEDFGNRLKVALEKLDKERNTPIGPFINHIVVTQGLEAGNIVIGVSRDAPNFSADRGTDEPKIEREKSDARDAITKSNETRKAKEKLARKDAEEPARKKEQAKKDKDKNKKEKPSPEAKTESRPRRVG